eukprot:4542278-Alexandrium_andersonii.AAC.1
MSASLVGSEMCIRDSARSGLRGSLRMVPAFSAGFAAPVAACGSRCPSVAACSTGADPCRACARRWLCGS